VTDGDEVSQEGADRVRRQLITGSTAVVIAMISAAARLSSRRSLSDARSPVAPPKGGSIPKRPPRSNGPRRWERVRSKTFPDPRTSWPVPQERPEGTDRRCVP
jgi:hypothetical protein